MENKQIAVLGGGSWATAIVKILTETVDKVNWWMRDEECIAHIKKFHHNPNYIQAIEFDVDKLNLSSDLQKTIDNSDMIIVAVPSAFFKSLSSDTCNGSFVLAKYCDFA